MYRPESCESIASKSYSLADEFILAKQSRNSLLVERLLILGYCILDNRWEEYEKDGKIVWKSTIYAEDYIEMGGATLKNTLNIFKNQFEKLTDSWVEIDGEKKHIIPMSEYQTGIITLYWNRELVKYLTPRANLSIR